MKVSIGDLVDRYTICKLKSERGQIDNSKEIHDILEELKDYDGIWPYVEKLYKLHGEIWDLEGDIRRGNEDILGLEEVGRRAIHLRDMNKIRITIKNEINSKYQEGYIEVKAHHGSEQFPSVVMTLTTVPDRLKFSGSEGIKLVMKYLCEQNDDDYEIHFNIPEFYNITGEEYVIPDWLHEYKLKYKHLRIYRTEDYGPPTKFVPTLKRVMDPETIILVVDDDLVYHPDMISEHRKHQSQIEGSVICYAGDGCVVPMHPTNGLRDSWIACVTEVRQAKSLEHYKSVSYRRKLFDDDLYKYYLGRTFSDDALVSKYCNDKGIKILVVPYEPENHLYATEELWNQNLKVESFPVLRHSHGAGYGETGCNHPKMIAHPIGQRFFNPPNLGDRSWENGKDEPRLMSWSPKRGYYYINDFPEPEINDNSNEKIENNFPMPPDTSG